MRYYLAPMEGVTDHVFRNIHHRYFPGIDKYFTPFFSPTNDGRFTGRSVRDLAPEVNTGLPVVPQLLTKRSEDFLWAAKALAERGYQEINLNLGCPSGTVVAKGKGSGALGDLDALRALLDGIFAQAPTAISIKTRLGRREPEEFYALMELFNAYPIAELTVHCRVREDFYRHPARPEWFDLAQRESKNPLCYNGDLLTVESTGSFLEQYPQTQALMLGRGLVADPSLVRQLQGGPAVERETLHRYTKELFEGYSEDFKSRKNAMGRMKEIWYYQLCLFDGAEKLGKKLRKATSPEEYEALVEELFETCSLRPEGIKPAW